MKQIHTQKQRGISLIELMISIVIGLFILAGVFELYFQSSRIEKVQQGYSRIQENARYVFARITDDISRAGYMGCIKFDPERIVNVLSDEVDAAGNLYYFDSPMEVGNGTGRPISSDTNLGTDILTFRYASEASRIPLIERSLPTEDIVVDSSHPNYANINQYDVAIVSDCSRSSVFMVTNTPDNSGVISHATGVSNPGAQSGSSQSNTSLDLGNSYGVTPGNDVAGGSVAYLYTGGTGGYRYSVDTSQAAVAKGGVECTEDSLEWCALYRETNNSLGATEASEIATGVSNFQIEAGWKDNAGNVYFGEPLSSVDWSVVDRIKVTMSFNSIDQVPSSTGNKLAEREFSRTIMLRNQVL